MVGMSWLRTLLTLLAVDAVRERLAGVQVVERRLRRVEHRCSRPRRTCRTRRQLSDPAVALLAELHRCSSRPERVHEVEVAGSRCAFSRARPSSMIGLNVILSRYGQLVAVVVLAPVVRVLHRGEVVVDASSSLNLNGPVPIRSLSQSLSVELRLGHDAEAAAAPEVATGTPPTASWSSTVDGHRVDDRRRLAMFWNTNDEQQRLPAGYLPAVGVEVVLHDRSRRAGCRRGT